MKVIITGSSGMIGKAVLIECLDSESVEKILVINRNSIGVHHPKLGELIHKDFSDFEPLSNSLGGYDACFHCMGVSAVGMNESTYTQMTYHFTKGLVDLLYKLNHEMVFNYVSGAGSDSTEKGRTMWARVKGKTENMILEKGFKDAYAFRPGMVLPEKGVKSKTGWYNFMYKIMKPLFPLFRNLSWVTLSSKIGKSMIHSVLYPQALKILENKDINQLAQRSA